MEFVRGPSWIPVRVALGFQALSVIAFALSVCFFAIIVTADFLINPQVGPTKIVVASLIGMICPTGLISTLLALPTVRLGRSWPVWVRQIVAGLPWLLLSHPALSLLPRIYGRTAADIIPDRFEWLWIPLALFGMVWGPANAQTWLARRALAKQNSTAARAKIAEIQAEAAKRTAQLQADLELQAERRRVFAEGQQAYHDANDAFQDARQRLGDIRTSARSSSRWPQFLDIERRFVQVLRSNPATSTDEYRTRAAAIRQFIRETDWQTPTNDLPSDRPDSLSGDVSGAAGR